MYNSIAEMKRNIKIGDKLTRVYSAVGLELEEFEVIKIYGNHIAIKTNDRNRGSNLYYNDDLMGKMKIEGDLLNIYDKKTEKLISSFNL